MNRFFTLSIATIAILYAQDNKDLGTIDVNATFETTTVKDVAGEEIKSADVASALAKKVPGISLVRRSGIANDIVVRGLKKDNLSITIDGAKLYGACPNRMDPTISHILANNIDYIEITEGAFDVTESGALGASIKIHTLKPSKNFKGDLNIGFGDWKYRKISTTMSGGTDNIRFYLGVSTEGSHQYEDGNGDNFYQQQERFISNNPSAKGMQYQSKYKDLEAYRKSTLLGKIFWDITDNQSMQVSYTANRSNNILYPNTPMDADYDNSNLFDTKYIISNLGEYSNKLTFHYFHTKVDHPMSNQYRNSAITKGVIKHWLHSKVDGGAIVNNWILANHSLESGIEYSVRNWDGNYYKNNQLFPASIRHSIYDVDTKDLGLYVKDSYISGNIKLDGGIRYDYIETDTPRVGNRDRTFDGISGNILATYNLNQNYSLFTGVGSAMRVPDPKELYFYNKKGMMIGDDNLKYVRNYEIDTGAEWDYQSFNTRVKGFYNYLSNDIFLNALQNRYENKDAYIYGVELSANYNYSNSLYFDSSFTWLRGKKKSPLEGETDTTMPNISPMKFTVGANWMPTDNWNLRAELQASGRWDKIDADNGEQVIGGWAVVNLKANRSWGEHLDLTVGVDNLFDKTYAVSNTYKDLTLITGGSTMLLNEPGRYIYTNIRYKF